MNIKEEKRQIIELLNRTEEEWVLKAVKRLLETDIHISAEEKALPNSSSSEG